MSNSFDYENTHIEHGSRNWLQIIYFILVVCKNGTLKTHVMYKCNLNSAQIQRYLQFLLEQKLVERDSLDSKRSLFKTTELGMKYINAYDQMMENLSVKFSNIKFQSRF